MALTWTELSEYEGRNFELARAQALGVGGSVSLGLPFCRMVTVFVSVSAATTLTFSISPNRGSDAFDCGTLVFGAAGTNVLTITDLCNWLRITSSGAITLTAVAVLLPLPREV